MSDCVKEPGSTPREGPRIREIKARKDCRVTFSSPAAGGDGLKLMLIVPNQKCGNKEQGSRVLVGCTEMILLAVFCL